MFPQRLKLLVDLFVTHHTLCARDAKTLRALEGEFWPHFDMQFERYWLAVFELDVVHMWLRGQQRADRQRLVRSAPSAGKGERVR